MSVGSAAPIVRRSRFWRRVRRVLPLALLLLVSFFLLVTISASAMRAVLEARNSQRVQAGVATGVLPWMTISYIARVYGVPETDLLAALSLSDTKQHRSAPLRAIANHEGRDLDADIVTLNRLIDARRSPLGTPRAIP